MQIEIKKENKDKLVIKHCVDEQNRVCKYDAQIVCDCCVATGNPNLPNRFEVK